MAFWKDIKATRKKFFLETDEDGSGLWTLDELKEHCKSAIDDETDPDRMFGFLIDTGTIAIEDGTKDQPIYKESDPVHVVGSRWYFWDETLQSAEGHGPYWDEAAAREELAKYCEYLDQQ